jgi:hypothetical protein
MNAKLLVPYNYSDPSVDFDYGREVNMDEYNETLLSTYRKYKPIIDRNIRTVHDIGRNLAINNEGQKEKQNYRQQNTYFSETKAIICDMNNRPLSIDTLIDYYKRKQMFIIDLQLPLYDKDEDLETEVKSWIKETLKINNARELTDDEKLVAYTKRDMKLLFDGSNSSAILKNTKLVDVVNNHTFAFLVEQIIFLK